jgi:hypothetical protein
MCFGRVWRHFQFVSIDAPALCTSTIRIEDVIVLLPVGISQKLHYTIY